MCGPPATRAQQFVGLRASGKPDLIQRFEVPPNCSSNPGMPQHPESVTSTEAAAEIERRLTELEIKASFNEDTLDQLNQVIVRQQLQIDLLIRELTQLRQQVPEGGPAGPRSLRDDLPPHY